MSSELDVARLAMLEAPAAANYAPGRRFARL